MSASFNRAHLLGNIGIINEKAFPNGGMIIEASLATNERYKDKNGEYKDMTQWHRLIFSGNLAELAKKLLVKGCSVFIEGKITYREYESQGAKKTITEIRVISFSLTGSAPSGERGTATATQNAQSIEVGEDPGNDLPF